MISKTEPCLVLVVSIQNQMTLGMASMIVWKIPVAWKLKLLFGNCADKTTLTLYMYCCEFHHHYEFFFLNDFNSGMDSKEWQIRRIK